MAPRAAASKQSRRRLTLVTEGSARERYPAPEEDDFNGDQYKRAQDLEEIIAALLTARRDDFYFLTAPGVSVMVYWKAKGGVGGGKATLGKCAKPSGLLAHITNADYLIWLAADHCRALKLTRFQIEALLYHELLHTGVDDRDKTYVRKHDFEGFMRELELYGPWKADIEEFISAARSLPFD